MVDEEARFFYKNKIIMAEYSKQDVVNDQYYISTGESTDTPGMNYTTRVFGYRNKMVMWAKVYKTATYATLKEAEEGHKQLKKEFS